MLAATHPQAILVYTSVAGHRAAIEQAAPLHIAVMVAGGYLLHLKAIAGNPDELVRRQTTLAYWLAAFVLVAGLLQVLSLQPALRAAGFRLRLVRSFWTPGIKRLFILSAPVALGAGILQLSVFMDKAIAAALSQYPEHDSLVTTFSLLGHTLPLPMKLGAITRLDLAQFLYQFPLGVFAIALATAIFPALSSNAVDADRTKFRAALRQGIDLSLFEGFAASVGLILVREPAIRLLFRNKLLTETDVHLIANSLAFYASAIWAFSLLQIINRAYYALHDTRTPFIIEQSMTRPSSTLPRPGPLWPPPRMAIGNFISRPKFTAEITSATSAHRAMSSGCLSIMAL